MQPNIYQASDHDIDRTVIDRDAIQVIHRLRQAGYEAYLVGGSVRDLLCKKTPKDYDISTSARPEQVKQVFQRQCILIGRRFRLAHIRYGQNKIIEVSTFRSGENESDLIVHDNQWGTPAEDVMRRDFTINGLFYDPENHAIIDYVGGWQDIHTKTLRTIGEPAVRFKQDPVRMLRCLKFRARFGFDIAPETKAALVECRQEIVKSSPARVLEEMLRMFESGHSKAFFHLLHDSGMLPLLFSVLSHHFNGPEGDELSAYLGASDEVVKTSTKFPPDRSILVAAVLYPLFEKQIKAMTPAPHLGTITIIATDLIRHYLMTAFSHFPRRMSASINFILTTQFRLTSLTGKKTPTIRLFRMSEFAFALRLLKIRAMVNPELQPTYIQWREQFRQYLRQNERPSQHSHSAPRRKRRHAPAR